MGLCKRTVGIEIKNLLGFNKETDSYENTLYYRLFFADFNTTPPKSFFNDYPIETNLNEVINKWILEGKNSNNE